MAELVLKGFLDDVVNNSFCFDENLLNKWDVSYSEDKYSGKFLNKGKHEAAVHYYLADFTLSQYFEKFNKNSSHIFMNIEKCEKDIAIKTGHSHYNINLSSVFELHDFSMIRIFENYVDMNDFDYYYKETDKIIDEISSFNSWTKDVKQVTDGYDQVLSSAMTDFFVKHNDLMMVFSQEENGIESSPVVDYAENIHQDFFSYQDSKVCDLSVYRDCMFTTWGFEPAVKKYIRQNIFMYLRTELLSYFKDRTKSF